MHQARSRYAKLAPGEKARCRRRSVHFGGDGVAGGHDHRNSHAALVDGGFRFLRGDGRRRAVVAQKDDHRVLQLGLSNRRHGRSGPRAEQAADVGVHVLHHGIEHVVVGGRRDATGHLKSERRLVKRIVRRVKRNRREPGRVVHRRRADPGSGVFDRLACRVNRAVRNQGIACVRVTLWPVLVVFWWHGRRLGWVYDSFERADEAVPAMIRGPVTGSIAEMPFAEETAFVALRLEQLGKGLHDHWVQLWRRRPAHSIAPGPGTGVERAAGGRAGRLGPGLVKVEAVPQHDTQVLQFPENHRPAGVRHYEHPALRAAVGDQYAVGAQIIGDNQQDVWFAAGGHIVLLWLCSTMDSSWGLRLYRLRSIHCGPSGAPSLPQVSETGIGAPKLQNLFSDIDIAIRARRVISILTGMDVTAVDNGDCREGGGIIS